MSPIRSFAVAVGVVVSETGGMPKRPYQKIVDSLAPPGDGRVRKKRTTGKEPRSARRWTDEEDAFVERHRKSMTERAMAAALGRSMGAIRYRRLNILRLPKAAAPKRWGVEDNAMLEALYDEVDPLFLAAVLSCSVPRMRQQAWRLGLRTTRFWSCEEDEILRKHFPCTPIADFVELLSSRSVQGIYRRASALSLCRGLPYVLSNWGNSKFFLYPPELQSLIRLHHQVERKLQDVQTQYRKHEGPPVQGA